MLKTLFVLCVLAAPALTAAAQVNKCLDASGKVVGYAAQCPPGTRSESTSIRNAPGDPASPQKALAERDAEFRKRQMDRQEAEAKAAQQSAQDAQRKRACDQARVYLKALEGRHRIQTTDPKTGERSFLNDGDYPKEIARAQRNVADNCK
jgi:hypothetical protein